MRTTRLALLALFAPLVLAAQATRPDSVRHATIAYRGFAPGVSYRDFAEHARALSRQGATPLACNTSRRTAQLMECGVLIRDPVDNAGFYLGAYVIEGRVAMISFGDSGSARLVERVQRELRGSLGPPHAAARGTWQWKNGRRILKLNWRGRGNARWIYVQMEDGDLLARISHYTATRR